MAALPPFLLSLLISSCLAATAYADQLPSHFGRSSFPPGFIFGSASAAYQVEGAAFEGGRGLSIWDTFTHKFPEKIADGSNGEVANDVYHRYKEDVKIMKFMGMDTFRMSISWSRILPNGKLSGGINKEGVAFYNNFFNELLKNGIIPFVTLFHWDVPQALDDEYGGFLSPHIVDDFRDFAKVCFKEFGDRVKHWTTLNEPFAFAAGGYAGYLGNTAPGRCSDRSICAAGNSATEPYIVAHHLLLCHATAVKLYKDKYQVVQKGEIGVTLVSGWFIPYSNSTLDAQAAQRALDFFLGWFMNPIVYGDYPKVMRSIVQHRLPTFTTEQSKLLKGSFDFIGLNYYTSSFAAHVLSRVENVSFTSDLSATLASERNGVPIGTPTGVPSFYSYPKGLYYVLVYIKKTYKDPYIYITENGVGHQNNGTVKQLITDPQRITFYVGHLEALRKAIHEGVKMKGFIAWSYMDSFEWTAGYTNQFGLVFVDRNNGLKRIPKRSAHWFKTFLKN